LGPVSGGESRLESLGRGGGGGRRALLVGLTQTRREVRNSSAESTGRTVLEGKTNKIDLYMSGALSYGIDREDSVCETLATNLFVSKLEYLKKPLFWMLLPTGDPFVLTRAQKLLDGDLSTRGGRELLMKPGSQAKNAAFSIAVLG